MKKLERILEREFKMIVLLDRINIINYIKIEELKENSIIVVAEKIIEIKGQNLTVNKMINKELLISGNIKKINII